MNQSLADQFEEVLSEPARSGGLCCERALRVGARTLSRATRGEITATTVVGVLGADDLAPFRALVATIADEFDLDSRVRLHVGSFSVRFSRRSWHRRRYSGGVPLNQPG